MRGTDPGHAASTGTARGPSAPPVAVPVPTAVEGPLDAASALAELDQLAQELGVRPVAPLPSAEAPSVRSVPKPARGAPPAPLPALYLGERIDQADRAVAALGHDLARDGAAPEPITRHLAEISSELRRARRELDFLASEVGFGFDPAPERAPWDESRLPTARLPSIPYQPVPDGPAAPPAGAPAYAAFTAERYDRAVGGLASRRRRLLYWTLGLSAAISVALEGLNLLAHEPTPAFWLVVLPLVWLVPVPFFVLAFVGTQRTLRWNRLATEVRS